MDIAYYKSKYEPIDGKWFINKKLGSGAFGTVLEVERRDQTNMKAAIKIVSVPSSSGEVASYREENYELDEQSISSYFYGFVEEFTKEIQLMSEIKGHGNVVTIEDYDVKKHTDEIGWDIFIRMELLTPMNKYFRNNPPKTRDVIKLGIDICKALEVCQKFNIVHRDIKPSNIFVSDAGEYKLGDFGVARTLEKTSSGLSKKGTYTYMAPEVYKGEAYGSNVDLYSLGIVMYKLLNGNKEPFRTSRLFEDGEKALVLRMKGETLPKPENANGRLAEIVLKACSYNPKERYESPLQMREELENILNEDVEIPIPVEEKKLVEPAPLPEDRYINGVYFKWNNAVMDVAKITDFAISYGDCPIVNVKYSKNKITVFNRINGSRDGWMKFPEGYFDERTIGLSEEENNQVLRIVKELDFANWVTPEHILRNHIDMATGFCVHNSFRCSFKSGEIFQCLEPDTKEFNKIVNILDDMIAKIEMEKKNIKGLDDEETIGLFGDGRKKEDGIENDEEKTVGLFETQKNTDSSKSESDFFSGINFEETFGELFKNAFGGTNEDVSKNNYTLKLIKEGTMPLAIDIYIDDKLYCREMNEKIWSVELPHGKHKIKLFVSGTKEKAFVDLFSKNTAQKRMEYNTAEFIVENSTDIKFSQKSVWEKLNVCVERSLVNTSVTKDDTHSTYALRFFNKEPLFLQVGNEKRYFPISVNVDGVHKYAREGGDFSIQLSSGKHEIQLEVDSAGDFKAKSKPIIVDHFESIDYGLYLENQKNLFIKILNK